MITHVRIDNFRSLENFDLTLNREQLLLGRNGSGKSSLFEAIDQVVRFVNGAKTGEVFLGNTITRWSNSPIQTFELSLTSGNSLFHYHLTLIAISRHQLTVSREQLLIGEKIIFDRNPKKTALYYDDGTPEADSPSLAPNASLLSELNGIKLTRLDAFRKCIGAIRIAAPNPRIIRADTASEEEILSRDLSNFASWYRSIIQVDYEFAGKLFEELRQTLPSFRKLKTITSKERNEKNVGTNTLTHSSKADSDSLRWLVSEWDTPGPESKPFDISFNELSDGQRVLIALTAMAVSAGPDTVLLLDEPDNYVALGEIQPLLMGLRMNTNIQLIIISHHPEIINVQAKEFGLVFEREGSGPTTWHKFEAAATSTLTPAEVIAYGEETESSSFSGEDSPADSVGNDTSGEVSNGGK